MFSSASVRRRVILISTATLLMMVLSGLSVATASATSTSPTHSAAAPASVVNAPRLGELDCNGYSTVQKAIDLTLNCAQPIGPNGIYTDNGWYVGHDEPGMRFISNAPGTGNSQVYKIQLPNNPTGKHGVQFFEDAAAPWFSMAICDPNSYPQQACTPDSDKNTGTGQLPTDAGSAVLELQFYGPGFPPFYAADSCDSTHWCAALNIDSLECTFGFASCNPACEEPVNFAFLTLNGTPIGPPSPQKATYATYDTTPSLTPLNDPNVLLMNPGDTVQLTMHDTANGLLTKVSDLTTGQSGYMVASAANGFQSTNLVTCAGTPFNFHPEYSSARVQNIAPWTALQLGVMADVDGVGHFEEYDHDADDTYCLQGPPGDHFGKVCLSADTDFDGVSYKVHGWAHTTVATSYHTSPWTLLDVVPGKLGPSSGGHAYPTIELQTDIGFTTVETGCNILAPDQCGIPDQYSTDMIPTYAGFYPYFSVNSDMTSPGACQTYFGNVSGPGIFTFDGQAGYGNSVPVGGGQSGPFVYGTDGAFYPNSCLPGAP
jgi:hypothetical protein